MKLNNEAAKAAWSDYKEFMRGMGIELENARGIEQAFKFAFAAGQAHQEEVEAAPAVSIDNKPFAEFKKGAKVEDLHPEVAEKLKAKTGIKRPKTRAYTMRTPKERQTHARLVASILQSAGKPMQLKDIIELVNNSGAEWYEKSASGHMLDAMEFQPCIKKVGFGMYEYQQ